MKATAADLARTHAAAFTQTRPWSAKEFSTLLNSHGVILCGDARSFVLGRVIADEAEVLTIATELQFQRQGLALAALSEFLNAARGAGALSVFLEVAADNDAAKSLYYNAGFIQQGQRPNYYTVANGQKIAADILRKSLSEQPPE